MRAATQEATQTPWAPPARATWPEGDARPICSLPAAPAELPTTPPGWSGYPQHPHAPQRTGWPSPPHPPSVRSLGPCLVRLSPKLSGSRASTGPIATHLPPGAPVDLSGLTAPNPGQLWGLTAATARGRGPPDPGYEPLHWVPFPSTPIWATLEPSDRSRLAQQRRDHRAQDTLLLLLQGLAPPAAPRTPASTGKLEAWGSPDGKVTTKGVAPRPRPVQHALALQAGLPGKLRSLRQHEPKKPDLDVSSELPTARRIKAPDPDQSWILVQGRTCSPGGVCGHLRPGHASQSNVTG